MRARGTAIYLSLSVSLSRSVNCTSSALASSRKCSTLCACCWRRLMSTKPTAAIPIRATGNTTTTAPPAKANDIATRARRNPTMMRLAGDMPPSFPREGRGQTELAARAPQPACVDELEVGALHAPERVQIVVVPTPVGCPAHVPGRAVVCHQRAVALEGPQHHSGLAREARHVEAPLEPHPLAHGREVGIRLARGEVACRVDEGLPGARHGDPEGV